MFRVAPRGVFVCFTQAAHARGVAVPGAVEAPARTRSTSNITIHDCCNSQPGDGEAWRATEVFIVAMWRIVLGPDSEANMLPG